MINLKKTKILQIKNHKKIKNNNNKLPPIKQRNKWCLEIMKLSRKIRKKGSTSNNNSINKSRTCSIKPKIKLSHHLSNKWCRQRRGRVKGKKKRNRREVSSSNNIIMMKSLNSQLLLKMRIKST